MQRQLFRPTPRPVRLKQEVVARVTGTVSCVLAVATILALAGNELAALIVIGLTLLVFQATIRSTLRQTRLMRTGTLVTATIEQREGFNHAIYIPEVNYTFTTPTGQIVQGVASLADTDYEAARESGELTIVYDPKNPEDCLPVVLCTAIDV